jgi:hypothetical protein
MTAGKDAARHLPIRLARYAQKTFSETLKPSLRNNLLRASATCAS